MSTFSLKFQAATYDPNYVQEVSDSMRARMRLLEPLKSLPDTHFTVEVPPARRRLTTNTDDPKPPKIYVKYEEGTKTMGAAFILEAWEAT